MTIRESELISKAFLQAKFIIDRYSQHDNRCSWHMTEVCDCGKTRNIDNYRITLNELKKELRK
jgi:hypothetical protein